MIQRLRTGCMKQNIKLLTILFFITINVVGQTPNFEWIKTVGGTGRDYGADICSDDSNNIYITGFFSGTVDFGLGGTPHIYSSQGGWDIFIQKIDCDGNLIWVKSIC